MVMQSVPAKRATNRLIRGNRTDMQKRHGSYSFPRDRTQGGKRGFPCREISFRSGNGFEDTCKYRLEIGIDTSLRFYHWDWQELVCAIGITCIPRMKRKEPFFDEFVASVAQLMLMKHRHGSFDDVEPPAGESMLIGNNCKEEVESKFFGLEVLDPLFGSQSMVEPCEMAWNLPYAIGNDGHEWFFKRHDWFSKLLMMSDVVDITCCSENRRAAFDWARKSQKLESFRLKKLSNLRSLGYLTQTKQSSDLAQKEVDSKKKIQQINKFR
jgi:hypothetical protein